MARLSAGRVIGGLTIPAAPKIFLGADDGWNFDQAGGCSQNSAPHAGIETNCMLDRRMAVRRIHFPFGNGPSSGKWSWPNSEIVAYGQLTDPSVIPMIAHGSQGGGATGFPVKTKDPTGTYVNVTPWNGFTGIDIIAQGKFDAAYTDAFTRIKQMAVPVIFNLFMEFNIPAMGAYGGFQGGVTNTGGAGPAAFKACWIHLWTLAQNLGADNMIWSWAPSFDNNAANYNPQATLYYPGDKYVDVIMLDLYRHYFAGNVDFLYNFAVARPNTYNPGLGAGMPFGIAESGYSELGSAGNTPNVSKATMVQELVASIKLPKYEETVFFIPWNHQGIKASWDDRIDTTPSALSAYQTLAIDSAFDVYASGGVNSSDSAPLNSVPPALNDTSPTQGEVISVADGQWQGVPAPTVTSVVEEAPNVAAAQFDPLCAYGMSAF